MTETSPVLPGQLRVVVVDDHPQVLEDTVSAFTQRGITVVGTARTGTDALAKVEQERPNVVLLDLDLSDMSGITAIRTLRQTHPSLAIVAISGYDEFEYGPTLAQFGVAAYMRKTASSDDLARVIRDVADGRSMDCSADPDTGVLTAAESEVLRLMAAGLGNADIARARGVSVKSVEFQVANILGKLGARSRNEAVILGASRNLCPSPDGLEER